MNQSALLPPGFQDSLADKTRLKLSIIEQCNTLFASMGYDPIDPPLVEFEQSLFTDAGAALENQTFRVLDPLSQKMVGIRADITVQVARIASTRLHNNPMPLRLSYSGDVMRVKGDGLDAERQLTQIGIECIGTNSTTADIEVLSTSIQTLYNNGITDITVDFTVPKLVSTLVEHAKLDDNTTEKLYYALEKKDIATIRSLGGSIGDMLATLTSSTDIENISLLIDSLPSDAHRDMCNSLKTITKEIKQLFPKLNLTVDFIEYKGYEYHTGVCFSLFSATHNLEVGRGGRYVIQNPSLPAVGCSLYVDALVSILPAVTVGKKIYIPYGVTTADTAHLREEGYITLHAIDDSDLDAQAKQLGCDYVYRDGTVTDVA